MLTRTLDRSGAWHLQQAGVANPTLAFSTEAQPYTLGVSGAPRFTP
jgi:hypothetical protein